VHEVGRVAIQPTMASDTLAALVWGLPVAQQEEEEEGEAAEEVEDQVQLLQE
jgi:hypothetical protein